MDQSVIQCIYEYLYITLLLKITIFCSMYSTVAVLKKCDELYLCEKYLKCAEDVRLAVCTNGLNAF